MKILCFIDSLGAGGAQRQLIELAKGFHERGHEVSFLTYHEINFFKPELDAVEIPVHTIVEANYWKRTLKIRRFIRRSKPDAVLAFLEASAFMATVAGYPWRKWKLVVGERSANPKILTSPKLRFYRFFHLFTDYVIANSHANMDLVKKANPFLPNRKCKVIYNIVNIPHIDLPESNSSDKIQIVVAASYRPVKNLDGLIEAIHLLPEEYKNKLRIDWYGNMDSSDYIQQMEVMIQEYRLKEVIFLHEATQEIFHKYAFADFVGLFSHHEGFPNTISEAMAMGKPIIATEVSDLPRLITDGLNGYLCDSKKIKTIEKNLRIALDVSETVKKKMSMINMGIAQKKFGKKDIIQKYLTYLN